VVQAPYERAAAAAVLRAAYPGTTCADIDDPDIPAAALTVCDLPAEPQPHAVPSTLHARYWAGDDVSGRPLVERDEPFLGYAFVPPACYDGNGSERCHAEWTGTLTVPAAGEYEFAVETRGRAQLEVSIDGRPVAGHRVHLDAGDHRVEARAVLPREVETGARLLWRQGDAPLTVVPFVAAD